MINGLVINTQKNFYYVKANQEVILCTIKGKLLLDKDKTNKPVVVGDKVFFEKTSEAVSTVPFGGTIIPAEVLTE